MKHNSRRYIQKQAMKSMDFVKYKYAHMGNGAKIVLLSLIACSIALFFPWIRIWDGALIWEETSLQVLSTSSLLWYVGIIHALCIAISFFFLFSQQKKEKIWYLLGFSLSQSRVILILASIMIVLTLHTFLSVSGLKYFSSDISYSRAIILSLAGNILLLVGVYLLRKENRKMYTGVYLKEEKESPSFHTIQQEKKDNMKLPF